MLAICASGAAPHAIQGKFEIHFVDNPQRQQQRFQTKVSILIIDSKVCLVEDLKVYDDNRTDEAYWNMVSG
jgi:hypothetical protein